MEFPFDCPFCGHTLVGGYRHEVTPKHPPQWAQDALDGAALRRLREALPEGWRFSVNGPNVDGHFNVVVNSDQETADHDLVVSCDGTPIPIVVQAAQEFGATIAEAADKCREALSDR